MDTSILLKPIKINGLELKNRFAVPAMATDFADKDGYPTERLCNYYTARAAGGFGLVITEVTGVRSDGKAVPLEPGIWDDSYIEPWKKVTDSVHAVGGRIFCQLHHAGRQTVPAFIYGQEPVGVSAIPCPADRALVHEMTEQECWDMVEAYSEAAVRAKKAGFDGVEVHGAHGYLIAQFMSAHSNKRTDYFGGSLDGRLNFPREVFRSIRKKVGRDYPMIFRIVHDQDVVSGITLEEAVIQAKMAEEETADAINVSMCTYASAEYMCPTPHLPSGYNQWATEVIKKSVNIPVMAVGRYNNPLSAADTIEAGRADIICFGRASIADPELPNKFKENRFDEVVPCISCDQGCVSALTRADRNFTLACFMNQMTGHEGVYDLSPVPDDKKKKVLVVGGGPAGLNAALCAARRGHNVILCNVGKLGGDFALAAVPPGKHEISTGIKYLIHMCEKTGVEIRRDTFVDEALIKEIAPDAIIIASGSKCAVPPIPGLDKVDFFTVEDVLGGKRMPGQKVLVCGGGSSGCEVADFLCEQGRYVTIVEMAPALGVDDMPTPRKFLFKRLNSWKNAKDSFEPALRAYTSAKIKQFTETGIVVEINGKDETLDGFDTVVLSLGTRPYNPVTEVAQKLCKEVYVVGSAVKSGNGLTAMETGFDAAMKL